MNENEENKDFRDLEFLAAKSKEVIDKQINSYRQKHGNAGIIIGVSALFIPFFLDGLDDSYMLVQYISILPMLMFIIAIILLLIVLLSRPLDQCFHVNKFDTLINDRYEDILLYEISANKNSFNDNRVPTRRFNVIYNWGISLTISAIIISSGLLLTNRFYKPERIDPPTKVEIVN